MPEALDWSDQGLQSALNSGYVVIVESNQFQAPRQFDCDKCDKTFKTVKALNGHMRKHRA